MRLFSLGVGLLMLWLVCRVDAADSASEQGTLSDLIASKATLVASREAQNPSVVLWSAICDNEPKNFRVIAGWSKLGKGREVAPELAVVFIELGVHGEGNDPPRIVIDRRDPSADQLLKFFWEPDETKQPPHNKPFARIELLPHPKIHTNATFDPRDSVWASHHYGQQYVLSSGDPGLMAFLAGVNRCGREDRNRGDFGKGSRLRCLYEPGTRPEDLIVVWQSSGGRNASFTMLTPTLTSASPMIVEELNAAGSHSTFEILPKGTIERIREGQQQSQRLEVFALGREGLVLSNVEKSSFEVHLLTGNLNAPESCQYRERTITEGLSGKSGPVWLKSLGIPQAGYSSQAASELIAWSVCSPVIWRSPTQPLSVDPELWAIPPWPLLQPGR